ncbi:MAG: hypothetical protein MJZ12_01245 [Prevotella sp.]|nr:hypothetical protein [Prevotella sp.]
MKKLFISLAVLFGFTANGMAQTDASEYFDGNAWGFATVSDESGTAYKLDGGMRAAQPKTIVLESNGGDNSSAIMSAINAYDIIVLDGSKGKFIIDSQMRIDNAQNKTIVGRNNAVLATKFFLTPEDIQYLKKQGLEGLSSTDQYTGTLPNGEKITCDKRAFFTKKAMMELQYQKIGEYSLPNRAGIFQINQTCENVIIRNLTFEGPGAVDIDGVDLVYNAYATHLWIDHCTFIDSQDGALDTRGDYATYTWNKFYYTERSYSHAYTCGLGWVSNHSTVLHVTWGCNEWGKGCQRRLPQGDDCFLHLVNNYHNCPGNSVGMTINSYAKALVENNYAAAGVNSPLTGSGDKRYIFARDNSFASASNTSEIVMPYQYSKFENKLVPSVLEGTHGAGATLDDGYFMPGAKKSAISNETFGFYSESFDVLVGNANNLPIKNLLGARYTLSSSNTDVVTIDGDKVKGIAAGTATITATVDDEVYGSFTATITINVTTPSSYGTYKIWDFTKIGSNIIAAIGGSSEWASDNTNVNQLKKEELKANGKVIPETEGLFFDCVATKMQVETKALRLNKEISTVIYIPNLKKDDKFIITWRSANATAERGFNLTNLSETQILTNGTNATKEMTVTEDGEVTLTVTGGLRVVTIEIQRQGVTGINPVISKDGKTSSATFNLSGQRVGKDYKGIVIENGRKIKK